MNNIDRQYKELLDHILHFGVDKADRTGTGTKSIFGWQIRHNMKEGFPLLTTKKMAWKTMVTELLWFLRGDTNIKFLVDNGCNIWNGDAYKRFAFINYYTDEELSMERFIELIKTDDKFAKQWGELGPIYGKQWRNWEFVFDWKGVAARMPIEWDIDSIENEKYGIDQIANLISELKTNPDSRRLMVSAWNVGELDQMVLPPCHYGFQVYTRKLSLKERYSIAKYDWPPDGLHNVAINRLEQRNIPRRAISLMWNQRSVDTFLGLPFNIASYALLLEIIAKEVNMVPEELIGNLGDVHLYSNHIEQAKEQITRTPYELPKLVHMKTDDFYKSLSEDPTLYHHLDVEDFVIENYLSHSAIKAPLSN
jgi:thymidylate synthase